jgi:hypothetical protein
MAKSCKGVADRTESETTKLGKMPNFTKAVNELIKKWAISDDMHDLQSRLLAEFENFGSVKFRVARALCEFREGLQHGGWMPLVYAAAEALDVDECTVRRWCTAYEKSQATPAVVLVSSVDRGPDPEAQKKLEIDRGTHQALQANQNLTIEDATELAKAEAPLHEPPPPAIHPLTPLEQWVSAGVQAEIGPLAQVPETNKQEVIMRIAAELLWIMTPCREPITITPTEPTVDRSDRRRQPELSISPSFRMSIGMSMSVTASMGTSIKMLRDQLGGVFQVSGKLLHARP